MGSWAFLRKVAITPTPQTSHIITMAMIFTAAQVLPRAILVLFTAPICRPVVIRIHVTIEFPDTHFAILIPKNMYFLLT